MTTKSLQRTVAFIIILVAIVGAWYWQPATANMAIQPTPPARQTAFQAAPKNIILLIGDGMGPAEVDAASMYAGGVTGTLSFESAPFQAEMTTHAADNAVTDSAAAATAMATGYKVNNGVISVQQPGDGSELETLLEYFQARCKSTGLVATSYVTHATPAAFGAHEPARGNLDEIADDYVTQTRPNVILGGGGHGMSPAAAMNAGYTVVTDRVGLQSIGAMSVTHLSGQFGDGHMAYEYDYYTGTTNFYDTNPHLAEMAQASLDMLDDDPDGFFLMIEGSRIDHAGHENDIRRNIFETLEFSDTVGVVQDWAAGRDDTLIIVTADHETGGLTILQNNGAGNFPTVDWSTSGHTATNVPVYAWGPGADWVAGAIDNTSIYYLARGNNEPASTCLDYDTYLPVQIFAGSGG